MAQLEYNVTRDAGRRGQLADNGFHDVISRLNDRPRTAQITTVTPNVVNSTLYTLLIDGVTFEYTSDGTATADEIVDAFVALINADPLVNPRVTAVNSASTLVLTANFPGIAFVVDDSDPNLTAAPTQANAEADPIPFGALVYALTGNREADIVDAPADIADAIGVTVREHSHEEDPDNPGSYPGGSDMSVIRQGRVIVATEEAVDATSDVYVGTDPTTAGQWRATAAANFTQVTSGLRWSEALSAELAVLVVDL